MKNNFFISLFFSFLSSFTLIHSEDITYEGTPYSGSFSNEDTTKLFKIIYLSPVQKNYLRFQIIDKGESSLENYIMAFSSFDEQCQENREQLSQGVDGFMQMWLSKAQTEKETNFISVQCIKTPCQYELNIEEFDYVELDLNSQYSYFITEENIQVEFLFSYEADVLSDFITLWAFGAENRNLETDLEEIDGYEKNKYTTGGDIWKLKRNENSNSDTFIMKVRATPGDFVNVGGQIISSENFENTKLIINQPEIKGYLIKDYSSNSDDECYKIISKTTYYNNSNEYYISGRLYSKIAEIYYKDYSGKVIEDSFFLIKNGSFIHTISPEELNPGFVCLGFPKAKEEKDIYNIAHIAFTIQIIDPKQAINKINLISKQANGEIYPRRLPGGEIFIFTGIPQLSEENNITYGMISEFGFPDMYFDECLTYPLCNYDDNKLKKITNPNGINSHTSFKIKNDPKRTAISSNQNLLIIKCFNKVDRKYYTCGFNTIIFSDTNRINLKEKELFSQFILGGNKDLYKIDYLGEIIIKKIYIDLILFTGDVMLDIIDTDLPKRKIYSANKISYIIDLENNNIQNVDYPSLKFDVKASKNSYYSLEFMFVRENDDSFLTNTIEPGISYLVTIDPNAKDSKGELKPYKIVQFPNSRIDDGLPFLVNFYSLNCYLNVTGKKIDENNKIVYEPIDSFGLFSQDIVLKNTKEYFFNNYEYILTITKTDSSIYNEKLCMVYASSLELNYNEEFDESQIVIGDNEPQQIVFTKGYSNVEYLYPHTEYSNDVIIRFELLDIAKYTINILFNYVDSKTTYIQTGNDVIYLLHHEWKDICNKDQICPIVIKISLTSTFIEKEPRLKLAIKSIHDSNPSYLQKNMVREDFLMGEQWQFYYTDLGKNEEGDVLVNYHRGSGRIFGRIVEKNSTEPEEGADWREIYKFPTTPEESLFYNGYVKKIYFDKENTHFCNEGCYLLLALKTSIESNLTLDYREHPFSILIKTRQPGNKDIPIIAMPVEEYIAGNLDNNNDTEINEFYSVLFPHDSEKVNIDFQSQEEINIYINIGSEKPSKNSYDFLFQKNGKDTIYSITRAEILNKAKEKGIIIPVENSIKGLDITIGLWANIEITLFTNIYSMKVHLPFDSQLNIYNVNSDQKTLCIPSQIGSSYRCLFMIYYLGLDNMNQVLIYPTLQDESASYEMHAGFIEQEKYEFYDRTYVNNNIPTRSSTYSTYKSKLNYIYIEHGEIADGFLFVSVTTNKPTIIELMSSFYTYDKRLSLNPSTPQLFVVKEDMFKLEITATEDLLFNFVSLGGEAELYWETEPERKYVLEGREDRLSFTSGIVEKTFNRTYSNLVIHNLNTTIEKYSSRSPGFSFFVRYYLRTETRNIDELLIGKSSNFAYRETHYPLILYSLIKDQSKDLNVFINFYDDIEENNINQPFEIKATFVKNSKIYEYKLNPEIEIDFSKKFSGFYSPSLKTFHMLIKKEDLEKLNIPQEEKPTLLIEIKKKGNSIFKYNSAISIEATVLQENSSIPATENVYQFGKLNLNLDKNIYLLKNDKSKKYMRIHFAFNSGYLIWSINKEPGNKKNDTSFENMSSEYINGRTILTFIVSNNINYLYLNIFLNDKTKDNQIVNYIFKYIFADDVNSFKSYQIENAEIDLEKEERNDDKYNYKLTVNSIPKHEQLKITYFVKIIDKKDMVKDESYQTIALTQSKGIVQQFINPDVKDDRKITFEIKGIDISYRYIQVLALIDDKNIHEIVSYDCIFIPDHTTEIILTIIAAVAILVFIGFLIWFLIKRHRIRTLNKRVETASFGYRPSKPDDNLLVGASRAST